MAHPTRSRSGAGGHHRPRVAHAVGLAVAAFGLATTWTRPLRAEEPTPTTTLDYATTEPARVCGDGELLRAKIAERIGRDPFASSPREADSSPRVMRVRIDRAKGSFKGEISLVGDKGAVVGRRVLEERTCEALVAAIAFTASVLLDDPSVKKAEDARAPSPAPPIAREPTPAETPPIASSAPTPVRAGPQRNLHVDASLSAAGLLGIAPALALGVDAEVGLDIDRFRVALGGRVSAPAAGDETVAVRTRIVVARATSCYGFALLSGCVVLSAGGVSGEGTGADVENSQLVSRFYASAGLAALSRVFLGDVVFVRASLEVDAALSRVAFDVGGTRAYTLPPLSLAGTLGVGARFE